MHLIDLFRIEIRMVSERSKVHFMTCSHLSFYDIQVLFQYDESPKVLELRQKQDVVVTVKECFSLDNEAWIMKRA